MGSLRDRFGIVLASSWLRFGVGLAPFWAFLAAFGHFYGLFFADVFGKLTAILSKMMHFMESTFCGFFGDVLGMLMQN